MTGVWTSLWITLAIQALVSLVVFTPPVLAPAAHAAVGVPASAVGLYVHELGAPQPLLVHNADRAMSPASTMKLLTTLAGLELLGPNFTWRTDAWIDGTLTGDVLDGNFILKGYGDPKITLQDFWMFLSDLRTRGLREIRGNLILDRSFFVVEDPDPAGFDNEPTRPYNVLPDALLINYKSVWKHVVRPRRLVVEA